MPDRYPISCESCVYSRPSADQCDLFGIPTGPSILCRAFRVAERQPHADARLRWPILEQLRPGTVYELPTPGPEPAAPRPLYRVTRLR